MKARLLEALVIMLVAAGASTLWLRPTEPPAASALSSAGVPGWPELDQAMPAGAQPPRAIPWREVAVDLSTEQRTQALQALRSRVPASEVPDGDVRAIFWVDCQFPGKSYRMGGFWVGEDRNVVMFWDQEAGRMADSSLLAPDTPSSYHEFQATFPNLSAAARRLREEFRYEGQPVVPMAPKSDQVPGDLQSIPGILEMEFADGWDAGCGHWSVGSVVMAPDRPLVHWGHLL